MKLLSKFLVFFFIITSAQAQETYKFDENHTTVVWTANHFGFSNPSGKFTDVKGDLTLDENDPEKSSVNVTIKTDSINTGIEKFDQHLKSADFFNTANFPTAKFVSTNVAITGKNRAKVMGNLTLLGATKEVVLDVKLNRIALNPFTQKKTAGFSAVANIKRSDFNMNFGIPGVSDMVKLTIEAEAILQDQPKQVAVSASEWKIIPEKSSISFKASQNNSAIEGSFKNFSGNIDFDKDRQNGNKILMTVETTSIKLSFDEILQILKDKNWLAIEGFPQATFFADNFSRSSDKNFTANGKLTIKDKSIPTTVNFSFKEYSKTTATAVGSFKINRSDFNIGNNDFDRNKQVDNTVEINFTITAEKPSNEASPKTNSTINSTKSSPSLQSIIR